MQKRTEFLAEELAFLDAASAHVQLENCHYEYGPGQYEGSVRYQEIRRMADFSCVGPRQPDCSGARPLSSRGIDTRRIARLQQRY